jgi:hypothetical protein
MSLMLALFQPDIPQNTGTMLRMCACLGVGAAITWNCWGVGVSGIGQFSVTVPPVEVASTSTWT